MALLLVWIIIGSGCAHTMVTAPLPLPPRPVLPAITSVELSTIQKEIRLKIIERDQLRRAYAEELEAVIKSTH